MKTVTKTDGRPLIRFTPYEVARIAVQMCESGHEALAESWLRHMAGRSKAPPLDHDVVAAWARWHRRDLFGSTEGQP